MLSLFTQDDERYTQEANELCERAAALLRPFIDEYIKAGFKIREIAYVLHAVVTEETLEAIIDRRS